MKIVRVLYGTYDGMWDDIPEQQYFEDEVVFVWGSFNEEKLRKFGYRTFLVSTLETDKEFSSWEKHFAHKLRALELADGMFDEYLFLDWDVYPVQKIDDKFYELIRAGNDIQVPLYTYYDGFFRDVKKYIERFPLPDGLYTFLKYQESELQKYHWEVWTDANTKLKVLPNFSFFYSRNAKIGKKLMELFHHHNILCCIEEFAFFKFVNCGNVSEYVEKYEPAVINGKSSDKVLPIDPYIQKLNKFVRNHNIKKDLYLVHDINYSHSSKYEN